MLSEDTGRARMPTTITTMDASSDTTTIFRWVVRSAVKKEELFIGILPCPSLASVVSPQPGERFDRPEKKLGASDASLNTPVPHKRTYESRSGFQVPLTFS